jgi:peptidoglycan/LPS O-acetylase OafA/YrhL
MLFFPIGVLAGLIVAWRREVTGAVISIGSLVLFFTWIFVRDGRLPGFPWWFLALAGPAFLFLAAALLQRRPRVELG